MTITDYLKDQIQKVDRGIENNKINLAKLEGEKIGLQYALTVVTNYKTEEVKEG